MHQSDNQRPSCLIAVCALFLTLSWIAVLLRFYVRGVLVKAIGADDYTALAGLLLLSWLNIGSIISAHAGFGLHITEIPIPHWEKIFKLWYLNSIAYIVCMAAIKLSICLSLHRIAIDRLHRHIIYLTAALTLLVSIFTVGMSIFQCSPVSFFWTRFAGAPGHCVPDRVIEATAWSQSAVSVVTDWTLALLPFWVIRGLKMERWTKVSVYLVLSLGSIACIATIVRLPTIKGLSKTHDFTYEAYYVGILSIVEPGIGLTATCLVTLRPLLRKLFNFPRVTSSSTTLSVTSRNRTKISFQQLDIEGNNDDVALRATTPASCEESRRNDSTHSDARSI